MSGNLFEEIARSRAQPGAPAARPDAQPAGAAELFEAIASQAAPPPLAPAPEPPAARGAGQQALRAAGQFGAGFNESAARTIGALPDLVASGLRAVGVPTSAPGQYTEWARQGINYLTGGPAPPPEGGLEAAARATGGGAADAASVFIPASAVARGARAGSLTQGVAGALASQPIMQTAAGMVGGAVGEVTDSPLAGLAASIAVPVAANAAGRAVVPVRSRLTPEQQRLLEVARAEGIPIRAAAATGSRPLQGAEAVWRTSPLTAGPMADADQATRSAYNAAVLRTAGSNADNAAPEVLEQIRGRIGQRFNDLSARNTLTADAELGNDLTGLVNDLRRRYPQQADVVSNYIRDYLGAFSGRSLPGTAYRNIDSDLGRRIRETSDGDLRGALGQVRDIFRRAMDRSVSPEDAQAWREARREWANFATIRDAMNGPSAATAAGDISPARLSQAVARGGQNYAMGRGDLNDLARVGRAFIQDQVPNSGTAERMTMAALLSGQYPATGVSAMAVNRALNAAYMNPAVQRYLAADYPMQRLMQNSPDMSRRMLAALLAGNPEGTLQGAQGALTAGAGAAAGLLP